MKNVFKFVGIGLVMSVTLSAIITFIPRNEERFVKLAEEVEPKSVMINIPAIVTRTALNIDQKGEITIKQSTVAVIISGAGVFVSPYGHVLTCAHLFGHGDESAPNICLYSGECVKGELLYKDDAKDLALVKIAVDLPVSYAEIADPRTVQVGQEVLAVGNPLREDFSVSHGIISALNRDDAGIYNANQSDTFINPGNSGGPLFNIYGQLVGINSRMIPPVAAPIFTGIGYSVSSGQIREFLARFRGL